MTDVNAGQNPPGGAVIYYYLSSGGSPTDSDVTLEISDSRNRVVRTFPPRPRLGEELAPASSVPSAAGVNRFVWDLRYEPALRIPNAPFWQGSLETPPAVPGKYQVRLTVNRVSQTQELELPPDPRINVSQDELARQFDLTTAILAKITQVHQAILQIRSTQAQLSELRARTASQSLLHAGAALERKIEAVEQVLIQTNATNTYDTFSFPVRLNNLLASLVQWMNRNDAQPTKQNYEMFAELAQQADRELVLWDQIIRTDLAEFNRLAQRENQPAVIPVMGTRP